MDRGLGVQGVRVTFNDRPNNSGSNLKGDNRLTFLVKVFGCTGRVARRIRAAVVCRKASAVLKMNGNFPIFHDGDDARNV